MSLRTLFLPPWLAACGMALVLVLGPGSAEASSVSYDGEDDPEEDEDEGEGEGEEDESDIDLDEEDNRRRDRQAPSKRKKRKRIVREVVKGAYAKVNLGPIFWLPPISGFTSSTGTEMDFSFGYDIVDRLSFTLSVEASFFQAITNGDGVSVDLLFGSPIQGDFRVFGGTVALRAGPNFGAKRVKRVALAFQIGGGGGYSPDLIELNSNPSALNRVAASGYGGVMQGRFLGIVTPGIGIEYYTKLAHFSIGLDVDADLILGGPIPAIGLGTNFFVKYTF